MKPSKNWHSIFCRERNLNCKMNFIIKSFFSTGLTYGLTMGLIWSSDRGIIEGLAGGLIAGAVFGLFMAVIPAIANNGQLTVSPATVQSR